MKQRKPLPIVKLRKVWYGISITLIVATLVVLFTQGLSLGIDFVGGTLHEIKFEQERPANDAVADSLAELADISSVQPIGDQSILLRYQNVDNATRQNILDTLSDNYGAVEEERFESIGPTIGQELRQKAIWAVLLVLAAIILYLTYAFRKVSQPIQSWKYGVLAIVAVTHDVTILLGVFAILSYLRGAEIDSLFVIAVLTTLGYSVHDTIVVFDRTRANLLEMGGDKFEKAVTLATNQTITRSINTSLTTLIPLTALLAFGGRSLQDFVLALMAGLLIGTFSSIFIASPLLIDWNRFRERRQRKRATN